MQDTIRRILTARVYDVAEETPLDPLRRLSARLDRPVLLKREDLQPVFSFKIRGAYNKIAGLSEDELSRGVICASAGNHAQGVALAAARRNARAVIVMPIIELVSRLAYSRAAAVVTLQSVRAFARPPLNASNAARQCSSCVGFSAATVTAPTAEPASNFVSSR